MHELSVCQSLISQVEGIALERDADSVSSITLGVGALSGIEPQLLSNAYPIASVGTIAEHAALIVENLPIRIRCKQCGSESDALANKLTCKVCGDWQTILISGDELLLMSVELTKSESASEDVMRSTQ
jgi:hydrogenase nickel incorporation protein HypA/HybF